MILGQGELYLWSWSLAVHFDATHIRGGPSEVWIDIFYHFDIAIQRHH
jgi:hypothetical protein